MINFVQISTMTIVIESSNPDTIQALAEVARALKATFRVEPDDFVVSEAEIQRRVKALQKFKGGLQKYSTDYQVAKTDWYQQ